jgi:Skp family chaperone for outer membrane proteins
MNLAAKPTAVAVVDMQQVFATLKAKGTLEATLEDEKATIQVEAQKKATALENLQQEINLLEPGTPNFEQRQKTLEDQNIQFQVWQRVQQMVINQRKAQGYEQLYKDVLGATGEIAAQEGFDIVLFKEAPVDFRTSKPENVGAAIQSRKVLWAADRLDITEKVVGLLNNRHEHGG